MSRSTDEQGMERDEGHDGHDGDCIAHRTRVRRDERGANLVEYCLLIVLIVLACIAGVTQFGKAVPSDSFVSVNASI